MGKLPLQARRQQGADLTSDLPISLEDDGLVLLDFGSETLESDFDSNYGLLKPEETVLIRAYSGDTDDRMLTDQTQVHCDV